jgi:hypothetical protein
MFPRTFVFFSCSGYGDDEAKAHEVDVFDKQITYHLRCGTDYAATQRRLWCFAMDYLG